MRKRKYVKISVDMFNNRKLKLIENMPERDIIEIIWMKLLLEATKTNNAGLIYLEEDMSYTANMLSIILGRSEKDIELALKVLCDLKMIEIDKNNFIKICSWSEHNENKRNSNIEKAKEANNINVIKNKRDNRPKENLSKNKKIDVIKFKNEKEEKIDIIEFHEETKSPPGKIIETFTF